MAEMPEPGLGFRVREYLGGGNWKSAYRASSPYNLADVALLFFHNDDKPDLVVKELTNLLRAAAGHRYGEYLAKFYGIQRGQDGRFFIVEELLARPLDRMAPLNDLLQFVRIARDLSRGLLCLHEHGLVHRDLKLDNCGLDHQMRAKIFDLGSVTSDGGDVKGTVLTRAPELFSGRKSRCDLRSDVWALGASLFALRTGDYPFVKRSEVLQRLSINDEIRDGKISPEEAVKKKEALNGSVAARILEESATKDLEGRLHSNFRGRAEGILAGMLEFDPNKRRDIAYFEESWSSLAQELGGTIPKAKEAASKWEKIKSQIVNVEKRDLTLTSRQLERIIADYMEERRDTPDGELEIALTKAKELA